MNVLAVATNTHQIVPRAYSRCQKNLSEHVATKTFRYGSEDIRVGILVRVLWWPYGTLRVDNVQRARSTTLNERNEKVKRTFTKITRVGRCS